MQSLKQRWLISRQPSPFLCSYAVKLWPWRRAAEGFYYYSRSPEAQVPDLFALPLPFSTAERRQFLQFCHWVWLSLKALEPLQQGAEELPNSKEPEAETIAEEQALQLLRSDLYMARALELLAQDHSSEKARKKPSTQELSPSQEIDSALLTKQAPAWVHWKQLLLQAQREIYLAGCKQCPDPSREESECLKLQEPSHDWLAATSHILEELQAQYPQASRITSSIGKIGSLP